MKQSEIKEMSVEDLREKLTGLKKEYDNLKMSHAVTPLENPLQLRKARRTVARLATELTKRENQ
jgi:large subunit ribosomal protein L29